MNVRLHRAVSDVNGARCESKDLVVESFLSSITPLTLMTEALGFITGAVCVYLTLRENVWNFPIGLANNLFFLVLFLQGRLFGDAALQIIYVVLGIQGWYQWLFGGVNETPRVARRLARRWRNGRCLAEDLLSAASCRRIVVTDT
jgi:nicotinamide riboside transporter PnuC